MAGGMSVAEALVEQFAQRWQENAAEHMDPASFGMADYSVPEDARAQARWWLNVLGHARLLSTDEAACRERWMRGQIMEAIAILEGGTEYEKMHVVEILRDALVPSPSTS